MPNVSPLASSGSAIERSEGRDRRGIAEVIQGVYAIVQISTGRLYVGSSNHVVRRLMPNVSPLASSGSAIERRQ
jgi:hypothetical protein